MTATSLMDFAPEGLLRRGFRSLDPQSSCSRRRGAAQRLRAQQGSVPLEDGSQRRRVEDTIRVAFQLFQAGAPESVLGGLVQWAKTSAQETLQNGGFAFQLALALAVLPGGIRSLPVDLSPVPDVHP
jgi:hypothetical protein